LTESETKVAESENDERWRDFLGQEHETIFSILPTDPRCQVCRIPFAGFGGVIGRILGFKRWNKNPSLCNRCLTSMPRGGIEIDTAVLFADIRGSTAIAEQLGPANFAKILHQYYKVATDVLVPRRAVIDKMIGDEVMALFLPLAGESYRRVAVESAIAIQHAVASAEWPGSKPRVGIGVYAGIAHIGRVGIEESDDFTALGDTVNVAARLQSVAGPGEVVVGGDLSEVASDLLANSSSQSVEIRGRQQPVNVQIIQVDSP
jgi:adenylate cyclase